MWVALAVFALIGVMVAVTAARVLANSVREVTKWERRESTIYHQRQTRTRRRR
jgi:hypothetical protein